MPYQCNHVLDHSNSICSVSCTIEDEISNQTELITWEQSFVTSMSECKNINFSGEVDLQY